MIIEIDGNKISCKQIDNGNWVCKDITIINPSIIDGIALMDKAIEKTETMLKKYNNGKHLKKSG